MRLLILLLLLTLLAISQINTILDSDPWFHIKAGEHIVKNLNIPKTDIFYYALENLEWIDHEWFFQVLFYLVFVKFGWLGINVFKAIIISLCFFILLFFITAKYNKIIYAILFILLSVLAFGYRSLPRPEIFSYLLLCIFFYVLENERMLSLLPFLEVAWVNLHGYFILGPALIFLYYLAELISGNQRKAKRLGVLFVLTCLACFINPYFAKGAFYPVKILRDFSGPHKTYGQIVAELIMPITVSFKGYFFFWILAILSSITFLINLKKARLHHILIFLGSFTASYIAARNMPIFIFLAMPLAAINLNEAKLTKDIPERRYYPVAALAIMICIYLFISNKYYAMTHQSALRRTEFKVSDAFIPSHACDFLEDNGIKGRIFNSFDFGHYLTYRFYPEKRIFIDARTELYKYDFYQLYKNAIHYPDTWEQLQKRYGFDIALVKHGFSGSIRRLIRYLYNHKEWALVYYDKKSVIFLHDVPANKIAIEKFKVNFRKKKLENEDININIAMFFEKIGEYRLAEQVYIKLLEKRPKFLEAANNLSAIYIDTGRFDEALDVMFKFLKYYPKRAELYANIGTAYLRMGLEEDGLYMLERAARLNPYLRQASYMLGLVYLKRGNRDAALRQFIKYKNMDPFDPGARRILGDIYKEKGLLNKAELEYNEADRLEGR